MKLDTRKKIHLEVIPFSFPTTLSHLQKGIWNWFQNRFSAPTFIQRLGWPVIDKGTNCLLAAQTGSGKTLTAFLPILGTLLTQSPVPFDRCLYISPLKALCNDACQNLRQVIEEIKGFYSPSIPTIRIGQRTGDSSTAARKKLLSEPPIIIATTPESLAVLLTQSSACRILKSVRWVIVDEIHALAGNKRGADLSLSLERLQELKKQEIQRIGLSATCYPLEEVAQFLVGSDRSCTICEVKENAPFQLNMELLGQLDSTSDGHPQRFFRELLDRLEREIKTFPTTLIFTNTRSLAERLTWALRHRYPEWAEQIAVHHSSLSVKLRRKTERQLKSGLLRVVISSTSLELGIDIGSVENVVLIHPPGDVVRLLQRLGRSGHRPGQMRHGLVFVSHAGEILEMAVTSSAGRSGQLEPIKVVKQPLDVLCQQLLGMASTQECDPDKTLSLVRRAYSYRNLSDRDFHNCLDYLSGRHADGREWLTPRLRWTEDRFRIRDARTLKILRRNLGTILSEKPFKVRLPDKKTVGELDPGFAERLLPGDRFLLDGRCLEVKRTEPTALIVEEIAGRPVAPRWLGGGWPLSPELAQRVFIFRVRAAEALRNAQAALAGILREEYQLSETITSNLLHLFELQESISEIPDVNTLLIEGVQTDHGTDYYFHTTLNRSGNEALARVLEFRLSKNGIRAGIPVVADLGFLLTLDSLVQMPPATLRPLLAPENFSEYLAEALEQSSLLKERFRHVAYSGLMLLRNPLGKRPKVGGQDWVERRLFQQVQNANNDFVLLRQARQELQEHWLDASSAIAYAQQMPGRTIRLRWLPCISPFAECWTQMLYSPEELLADSIEALEKLHATLMGEITPNTP